MTDRLDALVARNYTSNGETRTQWSKIGTAFAGRDGSWRVVMDALPLPSMNRDGALETVLHLRVPMAKRDDAPRPQARPLADDFDAAPF